MANYLRQQVREDDIYFIVTEITAHSHCIEHKSLLHGALSLPEARRADLMHEYNMHSDSYNYFCKLISMWVSMKGNLATTEALDTALRSIDWNAPADNLREKWFKEPRSTSGTSSAVGQSNATPASEPQSINTSLISNVSNLSNANFSNISIVGYQAHKN